MSKNNRVVLHCVPLTYHTYIHTLSFLESSLKLVSRAEQRSWGQSPCVPVGPVVGAAVGAKVSRGVGEMVGADDGRGDGAVVGVTVGPMVGDTFG
jgi:hypothetical protein